MTRKEIISNNELIAKFMGGLYSDIASAWGFGDARLDRIRRSGKLIDVVWAHSFEKELHYHSSYEWLMPVAKKIVTQFPEYDSEKKMEWVLNALMTADIEQIYEAVVEFIKWYNEQKK